jgi:predicted CXXCH cytochrome family protein
MRTSILRIAVMAAAIFVVGSVAAPVYAQDYVGAEACMTCHTDYYDSLGDTAHTKKTQPANKATVVVPEGLLDRKLSIPGSPVVFKLQFKSRSRLQLLLWDNHGNGPITYEVGRVMGGAGVAGKQRFVILVNEFGESAADGDDKVTHLISPVQYNHLAELQTGKDRFNAYHPEHWYDADGVLLGASSRYAARVTAGQFKNSWERRCIGCHATGPSVTYDTTTTMFLGDRFEYNVWCESCHGPGSDHVASTSAADIVNPVDLPAARGLDSCGRCHLRGSNAGNGNFSTGYPAKVRRNRIQFPVFGALIDKWYTPGEGVWKSSDEDLWGNNATETEFSKKHHQQWFGYRQSGHGEGGIQCWTCHDPHQQTAYPGQLVASAADNTLCLGCHEWSEAEITGHTKHSNNPATSGASRCVGCHMPQTAKSQSKYNLHKGDISSHTFEVVSPLLTSKMARKNGGTDTDGSAIPNGCNACHSTDDYGVALWRAWKQS